MQGFNRYFPPDFDPEKHVTLNNYHGKHALGVRASKLKHGGGLIVRFELPFNIWCGGCDAHIGQGVRFNAEKVKVGNYFSTPIYEFRCKCHICAKQIFAIQTDPKNTRYVVTSGARQQFQEWDPEEVGGLPIRDDSGKPANEGDAFAAVEKERTDKANALSAAERLEALEVVNDDRWSDPYTRSKRLRAAFRADKKVRNVRESEDSAIRDKYGLAKDIRLDTERAEHVEAASRAFHDGKQAMQADDGRKRRRIEASLGPASSSVAKVTATSSAADSLKARLLNQSKLGADPLLNTSFASAPSKVGRIAGIKR